MNDLLVLNNQDNDFLPASYPDRSRKQRLRRFLDYCEASNQHWLYVDLGKYRDYLLAEELAPVTVSNYLTTVRQRYRDLLDDNTFMNKLREYARAYCFAKGYESSPANIEALTHQAKETITNNINPRRSAVRITKSQDRPDSKFIWLTPDEANALLSAPLRKHGNTLRGWRDAAAIAILLFTGLRNKEVCNLEVQDVYESWNGHPAVHVRNGKGCKERMVPFGNLIYCRDTYIESWLELANLSSGALLRGFKSERVLSSDALSTRSLERILRNYPIERDGRTLFVTPHDCRRTYARQRYLEGMVPNAIRLNMGHDDSKTTHGYIGDFTDG